MNPDWIKWILISLSNYFDSHKETINLFIQGAERNQDQAEGAEFSTNGPFFFNPSRGYWIIDIDVNILITVFKNDSDIYKMQRFQGIISKSFASMIPVYKYDNPTDPNAETLEYELLGCLKLYGGRGDDIVILNFGEIAPNIRALQSVMSGTYRIELNE